MLYFQLTTASIILILNNEAHAKLKNNFYIFSVLSLSLNEIFISQNTPVIAMMKFCHNLLKYDEIDGSNYFEF